MECIEIGGAKLFRGDCLEAMRGMPDKAFSLAIVDPPYGIGINKGGVTLAGNGNFKGGNFKVEATKYSGGEWDQSPPDAVYFEELKRVSKNQIIWGGNYFNLPPTPCFIVWDKDNGESYQADCELAWTSFKTSVRKYSFRWWGLLQGNMKNKEVRIHPTQKPVELYRWLLINYAKEEDTILDTHAGSMSSVIACLDMGFNITAYERDEDYFREAVERVERAQQQLKLAL